MKRGAGRFILGIEGLTALVTGASALVAFVSALVLWLVVSDARSTIESSAYSRAEYIASALGTRPTQNTLEAMVRPTVPGGGVRAVAVSSPEGTFAAYPPISPSELDSGNTVAYTSPAGVRVTLLMELSPVLAQGGNIVLLLSLFAVFLTVVAILVPSYLRRMVLEPLKNILGQADRIEKGSGSSARAADASFRKLVDLLAKKDDQLKSMREDALKRARIAESRSGAVLEAMGSGVVVLDSSGTPTLWNGQAENILGPLDSEAEVPLPEGRDEWDHEKDGRNYRFKVTSSHTGERVVLLTDVTSSLTMERKLAEESALADLGALSGGVAHEIGNALCALEGFMQLLGRGGGASRTSEILTEASLELKSARKIVESFRSLSQNSSIESSLSMDEAADSIEEITGKHSVGFRSTGDLPAEGRIPGGHVLLGRILDNLLSNALRYCGPAGVSVHLDTVQSPPAMRIRVEDRGPGLPEDPEIVFRPMYTTEDKSGGMGLGLTITRRLVRAMGGTINACGGEHGGAVFTVIIPAIGEED